MDGTVRKHPVDEVLPIPRLAVLGLQHVLIMYTGCVTVPLVFGAAVGLDTSTIGLLINADLLVAGVITIIQALGVGRVLGVRLPVVAGATFAGVSPMILIASNHGLQAVYGSMLAAGVFGLLIATPFARVVRFFPPVVTGTVITIIGLSVINVAAGLILGPDPAADDYAQPVNLAIGFGVVLVIVLVTRFVRGLLGQLAVMIGLVLGTAVVGVRGDLDFSSVGDADWVGFAAPFHFGAPEFPPAAVIAMCVVMLVIFTESTADMLTVSKLVGKDLTRSDLRRGLMADGLSGVLAGFFNSFLDTVFAQNIGLLSVTRVRSRYVAATAGLFLVLLGLVPKMGEVIASLPGPVIGGAGLVMFGTVAAVGIRTLAEVEYEGTHNLTLVSVSLGLGLLPVAAPTAFVNLPEAFQTIAGNAITATAVTAFLLNLLLNHTGRFAPAGPMDSGVSVDAQAPAPVLDLGDVDRREP
ncbi:nucleobase:cation symporter-2 family protein [Kineosporia succinea]|uniref:NCS2 family nucleobase:cation symporter-2 n=1 Tax=Kineosporia succinea TaxID=84632 RepID=A0ABT9P2X1_9ACTN|nr:nucleobase:cation symporter-2 family protein [Kineosporia succinea]MDP9827031.1 NCS2 family nucleobase:cation symporter-2 [Kineosporia succinea]